MARIRFRMAKRLRTWALEKTDEQILIGYNFLSFRFLIGDTAVT